MESAVLPLRWVGEADDGYLEMLDQRLLPKQEVWQVMSTAEDVADGIRDMVIRGAPAIGIAAAYGVVLGARDGSTSLESVFEGLAETRPTAVNLTWSLRRMKHVVQAHEGGSDEALVKRLFEEARTIQREDRENNRRMSELGAELFDDGVKILTHCNTGGLATGGFGTALGIIRAADAQGKLEKAWIDETRPYLQGARLTTWECLEDDIPATLITDSMAGHFMKQGEVDAVVVGTDRVAANGDVANKIGTYSLAVLADAHDVPFYVAAPISTVDLETPSGDAIPIEERSREEVTQVGETTIAPQEIDVAHPAFDITPAEYVDALITEDGIVEPPYETNLKRLAESEAAE
jgi:methylthioribose-1-phosphate isomerase